MNQSINTDSKNSKEPQQKYRLGTVSIKILGGLNRFYRRLTFCYMTGIMNNRNEKVAHIQQIIFQQSLNTGLIPSDWKKAIVTPLFKKGDKCNPANDRLISLHAFVTN